MEQSETVTDVELGGAQNKVKQPCERHTELATAKPRGYEQVLSKSTSVSQSLSRLPSPDKVQHMERVESSPVFSQNELKFSLLVFVAVWIAAVLFAVCVTIPTGMNMALVKAILGSNPLTHAYLIGFIILSVNLSITVPIVVWVTLPLLLKLTGTWVFDQRRELPLDQSLLATTKKVEIAFADDGNVTANKSEANNQSINCSANGNGSVDPVEDDSTVATEDIVRQNTLFASVCRLLSLGIWPVPLKVFTETDSLQPVPVKWRMCVILVAAVIAVEYMVFLTANEWLFSQWRLTDLSAIDSSVPLQIRFAFNLFLDLLISIPILGYLVLPLVTNMLFVDWTYAKVPENKRNFFNSGFKCLR